MSPTWGLVATVKAPAEAVLDFAAWHLELGARRLTIYLDDPEDPVFPLLKAHPRISAIRCDDQYWRRRSKSGRPDKHQLRQVLNATHCYTRKNALDWLGHVDVDEFLLPETTVADALATLPDSCLSARMRPQEVLAPPPGSTATSLIRLRAFSLPLPQRQAETARIYPEFGDYLNGGMLSHVAGKLFVRKGLRDVTFKIHRVVAGEQEDPAQQELPQLPLAHLHAASWEAWRDHFAFRLARGAYRAELKPARPAHTGALNLHGLLSTLDAAEGEAGLHRFFTEVCADTPALRDRLMREGLLREAVMDLPALRRRHFPETSD